MRALVFLALAMLVSANVFAVPIYWNSWSSPSAGSLTSGATAVNVSFATTNPHGYAPSYPSWSPAGTFADGVVVDNGPVAANGIVSLFGGNAALNTLTFSTPVVNPVFAIWSLGQPGIDASFVFVGATPLFVSGGSTAEYGGSSISVSGNTVSGREGNGTVRFVGTFSSLQWINPTYENWYGFNVGIAGVNAKVPEPKPLLLFALGVGLLIGLRKFARSRA